MTPLEGEPLRLIPTQHVPENTADIGAQLRAARERKGQTLEAVGQVTRIPRKYLEALEHNRLDEFPALAYLRGFLKSYCDHLEMEFEPLWKQVVPETPAPASEAEGQKTPPPASGGKARGPERTAAGGHGVAPAATPVSSSGPALATAISGVAALVVIVAVLALRGRGPAEHAAPEAPPPPAALQPVAAPTDLRLVIELRDEAFLTVLVDGQTVYQARAPRNARQEWRAKRWIGLRSSRADALRLTLNGAAVPLPAPDPTGLHRLEVQ